MSIRVLRAGPLLAVCAFSAFAACGGRQSGDGNSVRLGFFPNITHSQALVGLAQGTFQEALGPDAMLVPLQFNAGPSVIEAMFAGEVDISYIGPNPSINGYVQSRGRALRVIAGATSGGAALVVRPDAGIRTAADLDRKRLATPQLGNTQDVALRNYLRVNGLAPSENGGTVDVIPTQNPQILDLFKLGRIHGAWVPEPWASRLVVEGQGVVFLDERDLWPDGDFVTANLIVRTEFLERHPDLVRRIVGAHVTTTQWELDHSDEALELLSGELLRLTGAALPREVLTQAWSRMRITWDPIAPSLLASAEAAYAAGFLAERPDLRGIYDLAILNGVLTARTLPIVQ